MSEDCALVVLNIISLNRLHLADLSELILFWAAIAESDSADVFFPATRYLSHNTTVRTIKWDSPCSPYPRSAQTTNNVPRSDSTFAQGICLRVSRQISLGQELRVASSNTLLKTVPPREERGKVDFPA